MSLGWERWVGDEGAIIGLDHFGASAPAGTIFKEFGFTPERVADVGRRVVREGLHGPQPTLSSPHGSHPTVGHGDPGVARTPGQRPRPRLRSDRRGDPLRVAFAADHAGAAFKDELIHRLVAALGGAHELTDLGGDGSDPNDDYPDFAQALGEAVRDGRADRGILICGSGVGASVAANKIPGIRAAICHDTYSAHQGVEHDDMNILTLRLPGHRDRARRRMLARVPRRHLLGRAAAPAPPRQGARDRGRRPRGRLTAGS